MASALGVAGTFVIYYMAMDMWGTPLADGGFPPGRGPVTFGIAIGMVLVSAVVAVLAFVVSLSRKN